MSFGKEFAALRQTSSVLDADRVRLSHKIEYLANDGLGLRAKLQHMITPEYIYSSTPQQNLDDCKEIHPLLAQYKAEVSEIVKLAVKCNYTVDVQTLMKIPKTLEFMMKMQKLNYQLNIPEMRAAAEVEIQKMKVENPGMMILYEKLKVCKTIGDVTKKDAKELVEIVKNA